jgi:hypothetical protein
VTTYGVAPQNLFVHAVPAIVRMEANEPPLGIRVDQAEATASVGDPFVQTDIVADAGLVEVEVDASSAAGDAELVVNADLIGASVTVNRPGIASSSNTPAGKATATAAAYLPALGIGIGSPPSASVTASAMNAFALTVGGSSAQVRALRVREVERTYRLPHENRTIKVKRS